MLSDGGHDGETGGTPLTPRELPTGYKGKLSSGFSVRFGSSIARNDCPNEAEWLIDRLGSNRSRTKGERGHIKKREDKWADCGWLEMRVNACLSRFIGKRGDRASVVDRIGRMKPMQPRSENLLGKRMSALCPQSVASFARS